jgi:DmsE family decaheme c-type cytochrome
MRTKTLIAACRLAAVLAAFLVALPALAQPRGTVPANVVPVCANCHEAQHQTVMLTAHGARNDANGSMCQACHGDATAHLQDPMKVKPANPLGKNATYAQKEGVCMSCHAGQRHLVFWESGKHAKNEIACTSCHNMHGKPSATVPVAPYTTSFRPNEADLCGTCHMQIRAAIMKPSHHPIIENKIKCSDCHNVHGALTPVMLKAETVNAQCYSCHSDKRGPFLFPHPPVEENCATCHNPHGSIYYKLLNEKLPNLCQDCHDVARHPGTPYGGAGTFLNPQTGQPQAPNTRLIARACTNCHNNVHGSNAPAVRGKTFIR